MMTAFSFWVNWLALLPYFSNYSAKNVNVRGNLCLIIFCRIMKILNTVPLISLCILLHKHKIICRL